jgi:hypothetical protein
MGVGKPSATLAVRGTVCGMQMTICVDTDQTYGPGSRHDQQRYPVHCPAQERGFVASDYYAGGWDTEQT